MAGQSGHSLSQVPGREKVVLVRIGITGLSNQATLGTKPVVNPLFVTTGNIETHPQHAMLIGKGLQILDRVELVTSAPPSTTPPATASASYPVVPVVEW